MGILDVLIIVAFILYALSSGLRSQAAASQNLEEYFLAGRTLRGWQAGLSMAATQFAADTPLLVTGMIALSGIFSLWRLWIYALAFLLMGFVLAASWRRAGVLTDAELTELRYGKKPAAVLRGAKAVYLGTIFNCTVLAMVLLAATRIAEPFLHWDVWMPAIHAPFESMVRTLGVRLAIDPDGADVWAKSANNVMSIGAIVLVTTFYSTTGGLRSVVATDVVQLGIMMVGTIAYAIWVIAKAGGLAAVTAKLGALVQPLHITSDQVLAFEPSQAKDVTMAVLMVFAVQWLAQMNADGTGYLAQRSMACRSDRDARQAAIIFTFTQVLLRGLVWLPIALGLLVLFPPDGARTLEQSQVFRESTYVLGIEQLPMGLKGLLLTGMLAALASTVDTHLNWGSSYWTNDLYKRFLCQSWLKREPSPRSLVWVARCANLLILFIALVIMSQLSSIRGAWEKSLLLGAGLGPMLVLRWLWWRVNAWGEIATVLASLLLLPVLLWLLPGGDVESEASRLLVMAAGATAAGITASLWMGPEEPERLEEFYRRAHPPGFWKPVAEATGADPGEGPRRLGLGLLAMAAASLSLFSLLTGFGSWLCASPAPTWFPWRWAWITGNIALGLALVPLWWRLGLREKEPLTPPVLTHSEPKEAVRV